MSILDDTRTDTQKLIDFCDNAGIEYRDYSGRGMYSERCFAIVTDNPVDTILELVSEAISSLDPESVSSLIESLRDSQQDSMGQCQSKANNAHFFNRSPRSRNGRRSPSRSLRAIKLESAHR
jgi:hypothetical protein